MMLSELPSRVNPFDKLRVKNFWEENRADMYLVVGIAFIALASFFAGRLSISLAPKPPITVEEIPIQLPADSLKETREESGALVASKNGKKYHLPDCPGAKQISEKNKIWFASVEEAVQMGYGPAANCPGLER